MSALWLVVGILGQKMLFIFLGLGSLVILRLFGLLPLDVSLGGPSDGGTGGSIVVSGVGRAGGELADYFNIILGVKLSAEVTDDFFWSGNGGQLLLTISLSRAFSSSRLMVLCVMTTTRC